MIQRRRKPFGYRVKRERKNASNYPGLAFAKGRTRAEEKREERADLVATISVVRQALFGLTNVCAVCGDPESVSDLKWPKRGHEMHEDPPRSKTRGLPASERFNLRVCMRICYGCHSAYTLHDVRCVAIDPLLGFAGDYDVERNVDGYWVRVRAVRGRA